jgi:hypothetical protein
VARGCDSRSHSPRVQGSYDENSDHYVQTKSPSSGSRRNFGPQWAMGSCSCFDVWPERALVEADWQLAVGCGAPGAAGGRQGQGCCLLVACRRTYAGNGRARRRLFVICCKAPPPRSPIEWPPGPAPYFSMCFHSLVYLAHVSCSCLLAAWACCGWGLAHHVAHHAPSKEGPSRSPSRRVRTCRLCCRCPCRQPPR